MKIKKSLRRNVEKQNVVNDIFMYLKGDGRLTHDY